MNRIIFIAFSIIVCLFIVSSCAHGIYYNVLNKSYSTEKLGSKDTIAVGPIVFKKELISKKLSDSLYLTLGKSIRCQLIKPEVIKKVLMKNNIYPQPEKLNELQCAKLSEALSVKYYLNTFIVVFNEPLLIDGQMYGDVGVRFDLYNLDQKRIIWSCDSFIQIFSPMAGNRNAGHELTSNAEEGFRKIINVVAKKEVKRIISKN